ncbi:MAG: YfdX family protein [Thermoproteota archaeon]|nr:YfdX family protein [Thermoproteota archaeon]
MNSKGPRYTVKLLDAVLISSLLFLTISFAGTVTFQKIDGQQEDQQNSSNFTNNSISNQTNGIANQSVTGVGSFGNQTSTNQTGTAALSANLTQVDFELLKQDLTEARQALENNDTTTLLDELNSASGELFQVISNQFDPVNVEGITQEFDPLQTHIDQAQEEALKGDHERTMVELSAAESELLKITQTLPSSQE